MSQLTMIKNPERVKDLKEMTNKLDRWDATVRVYEMKFDKDDVPNTVRQAAMYAVAPEALEETQVGWRERIGHLRPLRE